MIDHNWKIRALQLDLGRQIETLPFIFSSIDFIKESGYNMLLLYLEARVKTKTFPYPEPGSFYAPEEMKRIVAYAAERGIDVVPAIESLGHVEGFLRHKEMQHLAEMREGGKGRFSAGFSEYCPSLEEVKGFIAGYLMEIAELFPSPYMHVGMDEIWNIGYCSKCRKRLEQGESQGNLFVSHIRFLHSVVKGKLGKRMIMWSDMFEHYPEVIKDVPRDVIMCCWHYDSLVEMPQSHFGNRLRYDALSLFAQQGFETIIAPWECNARNSISYTQYARGKERVLGGLLTTWEKSCVSLMECFPVIGMVGRLWSGLADADNAREAFTQTAANIFGTSDEELLDAVWNLVNLDTLPTVVNPLACLRGVIRPYFHERAITMENIAKALRRREAQITTEAGRAVWEDLLIIADNESVFLSWRRILPEMLFRLNKLRGGDLAGLFAEGNNLLLRVEDLRQRRQRQWDKYRNGLKPEGAVILLERIKTAFAAFLEELERGSGNTGVLIVRCFLPEHYGSQVVRVSIRYADNPAWRERHNGNMKPENCEHSDAPFFEIDLPISTNKVPEAIRIETSGYGGMGFTFCEAANKCGHFVPDLILFSSGKVNNPEALLINNTRWCMMGEQDSERAFIERELAAAEHVLELQLRKQAGSEM